MTKFEEEAMNEFAKSEYVYTAYDGTFRGKTDGTVMEFAKGTTIYTFPWLEFAKNWHSDEEFKAEIKKLTDQLITRNDELISSNYEIESLKSQLISREKQVIELKEADKAQGKEIIQLKSQLQQQALPVVKDFVAEWVECVKGKDNNATALLTDLDNMPDDVNEWLFFQRNDDNINLILRAWLDGYTVEKPQLFYLKNKLTRKYLRKSKHTKDDWNEEFDRVETVNNKTKFTQQEIDSMQTGSYELVPVEDGE